MMGAARWCAAQARGCSWCPCPVNARGSTSTRPKIGPRGESRRNNPTKENGAVTRPVSKLHRVPPLRDYFTSKLASCFFSDRRAAV